jgi:hypothetical protein
MEEYKKIANYDNYSISNLGNVRNDMTNNILKPWINSHYYNSYYYVILYKNGKMKNMRVRRVSYNSLLQIQIVNHA